MANDIKLDNALDQHLRPLKSNGEVTAIETASQGNGARVNGDLEITGKVPLVKTGRVNSSEDITLDATEEIHLAQGGDNYGFFSHTGAYTHLRLYENGGATTDDYFDIRVKVNGGTDFITYDSGGSAGHMSLKADGVILLDASSGITLDSASGEFAMNEDGSKFADMYAGLILGCTHVYGSGTNGVFQAVTTAWESLLWDTDKYALVTFKVPPSNRVKISVFLPYVQLGGYILQLGLATDSSATSLNTKYENNVWDVDESDTVAINYSWVVEGSDHSWSAGDTETLYIMAYADGATRLYTGGTAGDKYGGVIVEATALPATIGDGSEP